MKCEDKIKYPSEEHAYKAMKQKHKKGLITLRYYKCECSSWHLTSKPNEKKG